MPTEIKRSYLVLTGLTIIIYSKTIDVPGMYNEEAFVHFCQFLGVIIK